MALLLSFFECGVHAQFCSSTVHLAAHGLRKNTSDLFTVFEDKLGKEQEA
jgi:hypothetical protein